MPLKIILLYVFMNFLWGATWTASKAGVAHLPPFLFAGARCVLAVLFLGMILLFRGASLKIKKNEIKPLITLGIMVMAIPFGLMMLGMKYTTGGIAAVILATNPIFIFIISLFSKDREKPTLQRILGTLLGLLGSILIFLPEFISHNINSIKGDAIMLFCSFIFAFGILYARKHTQNISADKTTFYQTIFAIPVLFLIGSVFESPGVFINNIHITEAWGSLLFLAFFGNTIAILTFYWFIKHYGAAVASSSIYLEIVFAILLDWIILKTSPSVYSWFGIGTIAIGIWLVTRKQKPILSETVSPVMPEL